MSNNTAPKSLNPLAREWRPTPAPAPSPPHLLPGILYPAPSSYSAHCPSLPIPPALQQPYHYYVHPFPAHEVSSFPPDHQHFNNGDPIVETHQNEGVVASATNANVVQVNPNLINKGKRRPVLPPRLRRAPRPVPPPPARQEWRGSQSRQRSGGLGLCQFSLRPSSASTHFANPNTTVMIKNIPNKFSKGNNFGYGFVNFTAAKDAQQFWNVLQNYKWGRVQTDIGFINSKKICQITWARVQGKKDLIKKFEKSIFECREEEFLPVVLEPPRNGWNSDESIPKVIGNILY